MQSKMKIKMAIDFLMTVLLLFLMAFQITGQKLHEWIGAGMLVLFAVHNLLNYRWYGSLFKGKYRLPRIVQTLINISLLLTMLCLGFSGIVMSRYAFAVFSIKGPLATARTMHLATSYWGFVLMSVHAGLHFGMVWGIFGKLLKGKGKSGIMIWILRGIAVLFAGYGLYLFLQKNLLSYMFLKVHFVFFDYEQSAAMVLLEYLAIMEFWIFVAYYAAKGIGKESTRFDSFRFPH